jgi:VanZ family protein
VWWVATAGYAALLFAVSVMPVAAGPSVPYLDKAVHLGEYLLFAWLLVQALPPIALVGGRAWLSATSYGVLMELMQAMVPWRSAEPMDAVANGLGAALGAWWGGWMRSGV